MSRACAIGRREAGRQSGEFSVPVLHHVTQGFIANPTFAKGAGNTPEICGCQAKEREKITTAGEIIGGTTQILRD